MKNRFRSLRFAGPAFAAVLSFLVSPARADIAPGDPAMKFNKLETFMMGITQPTDMAFLPDGRALVLSRNGDITLRTVAGVVIKKASRPPGNVDISKSEQGLLGVVVDPDFATTKAVYFYVSNGPDTNNKHQVMKATIADDNKFTWDPKLVVSGGLVGPDNHNGGGLIIHKNQLYVSVGDTGYNATPPTNKNGACLNHANGKILRVNLDGSIPSDNPLHGLTQVTGCQNVNPVGGGFSMQPPDERIYAWGLRNPFRIWIDSATDLLWIGEVGEGAREQIEVGGKGTNFGWPFYEGTVMYNQAFAPANKCMGMTPATVCKPPEAEWDHSNNDNCSIGGLIPNGCGWPTDYQGKYFFGDHGSHNIYTADVKVDRSGLVAGTRRLFASLPGGMSSFHQGPDGNLYVTIDGDGSVVRIVPLNRPASCLNLGEVPDGGSAPMLDAAAKDAAAKDALAVGPESGVSPVDGVPGATDGEIASKDSGGTTTMSAKDGGGSFDGNSDDGGTAQGGTSGGCGCRIAGRRGSDAQWLLVALSLGCAVARKKKRRAKG